MEIATTTDLYHYFPSSTKSWSLRHHFYDHVHNMINFKAQYRFLHCRSCVSQLLDTLKRIGQLLSGVVQTDVVSLCFGEAFDSVDYAIPFQCVVIVGVASE